MNKSELSWVSHEPFEPLSIHLIDPVPCPFCGSVRIIKGDRWFGMCVDCGATGPERTGKSNLNKVTLDWNSRTVKIPIIEQDLGNIYPFPNDLEK